MFGAVALALFWPELGSNKGPLQLGLVTSIGIAAVFFLHGANLSPQALRAGAAHWRLHLLVQTTTFVIFPFMGMVIWFASREMLSEELRLGFFYLTVLPSTISSSIAMTALARGNVAVAVFDATISGLIGMVATPLFIGLLTTLGPPGGVSSFKAILGIMTTLLFPFAAGQIARHFVGTWVMRNKRITAFLDRSVIVLIVFSSFCDSTASGLWRQFSASTLLVVAALTMFILVCALFYAKTLSRIIGFDRADEAAAVFCASKKSLANGAPMAKILFVGNPALGIIMLPLLLYHQIQLIVCAQMARSYAMLADKPVAQLDEIKI